jgi:hypothetical protein
MGLLVENGLEILVLGTALLLVIASFLFEQAPSRRRVFGSVFLLLAALSVAGFFNLGTLRNGRHVHAREQFHFILGSKYLTELRYDKIYEAAITAAKHDGILPDRPIRYRDLVTRKVRRSPLPPQSERGARERFTPERWREFRDDTAFLFRTRHLTDHGNTGSPAWAMVAGLFTNALPLSKAATRVFGSLDLILLLILFVTVRHTFGKRTMALTMIIGLSVPLVYRYLGGSILRMDWLFALGMSLCLFEKRRFRTAGVFLGYAVASKVLAAAMVMPLGLFLLVRAVRERQIDRDHLRYVLFAVIGLGSFVVLSALYFADIEIWRDYAARIYETYQADYYRRQHSFRDLFLQAVHSPASAWLPLPDEIASASRAVSVDQVRAGFVAAQILLVGGLTFVAVRNPVRVAFALGPLLVFVLLVTNRYYWQMWMISAIALAPTYRRDWRHAVFLAAIVAWLGAGHLGVLARLDPARAAYLGSAGLFWVGAAVVGLEGVSWYGRRRRGAGPGGGTSTPPARP